MFLTNIFLLADLPINRSSNHVSVAIDNVIEGFLFFAFLLCIFVMMNSHRVSYSAYVLFLLYGHLNYKRKIETLITFLARDAVR